MRSARSLLLSATSLSSILYLNRLKLDYGSDLYKFLFTLSSSITEFLLRVDDVFMISSKAEWNRSSYLSNLLTISWSGLLLPPSLDISVFNNSIYWS